MKKLLRNGFLLIIVLVLIRGWLFRLTVAYHPISERATIAIEDEGFAQSIENQGIDTTLEYLVKRSLKLTT
ncbi:MAG: hypothetical protein IT258_07225 [Saprospiraceae bacterium]|nr:hypothetical protein [Saprospiraceae bacterium]